MVSKRAKQKRKKTYDPKAPQGAGYKDSKDNALCAIEMMYSKTRVGRDVTGMNDKTVDDQSALKVMESILTQDVGVNRKALMYPGMDMDLTPLQVIILKFLKQHRRLQFFQKLASKHLSLKTLRKVATVGNKQVPLDAVFETLRFVTWRIVPFKLLGSSANWRKFLKGVKHLLWSSRSQKLALGSLVRGMKVLDVPWLHHVKSNSLRLNLLACTVKWLFTWQQNLVRTFWYVTESIPQRGLVYICQRDWQSLSDRALNDMIRAKKLRLADNSFDEGRVVAQGSFRFIPKADGTLRPISIITKSEASNDEQLLLETKALLWQVAHLTGALFVPMGQNFSGALNASLKQLRSQYTSVPQYYFVRADISDAYGSIKHSKLLKILQLIKDHILPADGELQLRHLLRPKKTDVYKKTIIFHTNKIVFSIPDSWIDTGKRETRKVLPMLILMSNMIHRLGIRVGQNLFRCMHGIPQGMVLSAVLCELYYSFLDKEHLASFRSEKELLIRYCDDYLYLTPHRERAQQFLNKLQAGFQSFSCYINPNKTQTNLNDSTKLVVPFVGFNIRIDNLNVEGNFHSFEGQNIAHFMAMDHISKIGRVIERRMSIVLKLDAILVDLNLNSRHTVLLNVFQAALLMAFRMHGLVRSSFTPRTVNQKFVLRCVCRAVSRISNLVKQSMKATCPNQSQRVERTELSWLGLKAFEYRTSRSGAHYPKLVKIIKRKRKKLETQMPKIKLTVLRKITKSIPAAFMTMK